MSERKLKRNDLVYPDLGYKIMGILFEVWTSVGSGHKESFYQKAVSHNLKLNGLQFTEQLPAKLHFKGKFIGVYYFDFLIEDKIVLELKVREYFSKHDINQIYSYLKSKNLKLGLIAHFTKSGVKFRRIININ